MIRDNHSLTETSTLKHLTIGLKQTFQRINLMYHQNDRELSNAKRLLLQDQSLNQMYYNYSTNECLMSRYVILSSLGKGSFGEVVMAMDTKTNTHVAIKITRGSDFFYKRADIEFAIYKKLQESQSPEKRYVVQLFDHVFWYTPEPHSFVYNHHQCFVFELLSLSLFDVLRVNGYVGIQIESIQRIAYQLLNAVKFLHRQENQVIHGDIKPENILLTSRDGADIKLIDFGSACYANSVHVSYVQSRYYRAPEILLGLPYDDRIDLWSVGCVLFELYTGEPLFRGRNELEQLNVITAVLGNPPSALIEASRKKEMFYMQTRVRGDGSAHYILRAVSRGVSRGVSRQQRLQMESLAAVPTSPTSAALVPAFRDLLRDLLQWEAAKRVSAEEALRSPFFSSFSSAKGGSLLQAANPQSCLSTALYRCCESVAHFEEELPNPQKHQETRETQEGQGQESPLLVLSPALGSPGSLALYEKPLCLPSIPDVADLPPRMGLAEQLNVLRDIGHLGGALASSERHARSTSSITQMKKIKSMLASHNHKHKRNLTCPTLSPTMRTDTPEQVECRTPSPLLLQSAPLVGPRELNKNHSTVSCLSKSSIE